MQLAGNTGCKKNRHLGTIVRLWAESSQLRHVSTIEKKTAILPPHVPTIWQT